MVRFPRSWGRIPVHPQACRPGNALSYLPGWRGSGARPMTATPLTAYTGKISGVPLTGGQAQGLIPASGALTLSTGPQGLGTVWYPAQVTISTTTGALDTSAALVYAGPSTILTPATLVGTVYSGNGTVALALPDMTPGQVVTVAWTGGNPGDQAGVNVIGTMDALTTS